MAKTIAGVIASLLVFAAPAAAEDRPAATPPPNAEALAHRAMHDAMLKHATPPADLPRMPEHAAVHAGTGEAGAQAHHQIAEHLAQRHATSDRERRREGSGHPAGRGENGSGAGMMNGHGAGFEGGAGACDNPAGPVRTMERHGGPGGMTGGGAGGDHSGDPGAAPGPHGGQMDGLN